MRQSAWIYLLVASTVLYLPSETARAQPAPAAPVCEFEGIDGAGNRLSCGSGAVGGSVIDWNSYFQRRSSPEKRAMKSIAKAERAQARGDYPTAIAHYLAALGQADVAPLRIALGQAYIMNGQYEPGIYECRRGNELRLLAGFCEAWGTYGKGDLRGAANGFGMVQVELAYASASHAPVPHMSPDQVRQFTYLVSFMRASMLYRLGDYEDAATEFRSALRRKPGDPAALKGMGLAAREAELWADDEWAMRQLHDQMPKDTATITYLTSALSRQKKYAEAEPLYEKAIKLEPKNVYHHSSLSSTRLLLGKFDEAERSARRAYELEPNAWHSRLLGEALMKQGKHDESISYLEKAVQLKPGDRFNRMVLDDARAAAAHGSLGTKEEAGKVFDTPGSLVADVPAVPVPQAPVEEGLARTANPDVVDPLPPGLVDDPDYQRIQQRRQRLESLRTDLEHEIEQTDRQLETGKIDKNEWSAKRSDSKQDLANLDVMIGRSKKEEKVVYNRYTISVDEQDQADTQATGQADGDAGGTR